MASRISPLAEALKAAQSSIQRGTQNQQNFTTLGVRQQRNDAITAIGAERNRIAGEGLALKTTAAGQAEEKFNIEQKIRKESLAKAEAENEATQEALAKKKDFKTDEDHLAKAFGGNAFPDMLAPFRTLLDTVNRGQGADADGNYSSGTVEDTFKALNDPKKPIPGGGELQKNIIQAGIQQGTNKVEVLKADFAKMVEKNPMLGTNPEAVKADPKAAEAQEGITAITEVVDSFRNFKSEIDAFTKQSQVEIEQEKQVQQELESVQGRVDALQQQQFAQGIVNQARASKESGNIRRIDLALKANNVPSDLSEMTKEQASAVLATLKETSSDPFGDIATFIGSSGKSKSWFDDVLAISGGLLKKGIGKIIGSEQEDAISDKDQDLINNITK